MFFKKKIFWLMFFITVLGSVLRLAFIDKPDGLWNDEYISWMIASIPWGKNFFHEIFAQCHLPFYYFYLKFFIHFFGNSDLMLRLTSFFPGILSIIAMYFTGKEFKNEKLGILSASVAALSSFLIYFSQEVRFYELLFLFSALSLLFTIKLCKEQKLSNIILYILSNFLIIITHTIGFIFVLFNLIFISIFLSKNKKYKKIILIIWGTLFLASLSFLPLFLKIFSTHSQSQWWGTFTFSKLGFLITDYFSPVLTNIVSSPDNFLNVINFQFVIFAIIPSLIAISGIFKALYNIKEEKKIIGSFTLCHCLFAVCTAYLLILLFAAMFGKLVFITKYSIEIYPTLILLMSYGLIQFNKNWRYSLIFIFCFLNMFYIFTSPVSAPKIRRSEGHKIVANLLENAKLNKNDLILLTYYPPQRFKKYFDFSNYNTAYIHKGNYPEYLGVNSKENFRNINNTYFDLKFKKDILNQIKPGQKIALVVLNDVSIYSPTQMHNLMINSKDYKKAPFLFLVFSYVKNETMKECLSHLEILRFEEKGSWSVITFIKK